jgi:hypothetical protein
MGEGFVEGFMISSHSRMLKPVAKFRLFFGLLFVPFSAVDDGRLEASPLHEGIEG